MKIDIEMSAQERQIMKIQNNASASVEKPKPTRKKKKSRAKEEKVLLKPAQEIRLHTEKSLTPTTRNVQSVSSEPRIRKLTFMSLPPEVRNMIYSYAISTPTCVALFPKNTDPAIPQACRACNASPRTLTITNYPLLPYPQRRPTSQNQIEPESFPDKSLTKWKTSITVIHLTNKAISHESIMYMYETLELRVRESSLLRRVFTTVPTYNLSFLKNLRFTHQMYGEPHQVDHIKWKTRADASWSKLIQEIVANMPNLESFTLILFNSDTPFRLNMTEKWVQPLLQIKALTKLKNLKIEVQSRVRRGKHEEAKESKTPKACNQATVMDRARVLFELALVSKILGATDGEALKEYSEYVDHLEQVTPHISGGYGVREVMHWLK